MDNYELRPNALGDGWIVSKYERAYATPPPRGSKAWKRHNKRLGPGFNSSLLFSYFWLLPAWGIMSQGEMSRGGWKFGATYTLSVWAVWIIADCFLRASWRNTAQKLAPRWKRRLSTALRAVALPMWYGAITLAVHQSRGSVWVHVVVPLLLCISTLLSPTSTEAKDGYEKP